MIEEKNGKGEAQRDEMGRKGKGGGAVDASLGWVVHPLHPSFPGISLTFFSDHLISL